jgi:hypothetical protein
LKLLLLLLLLQPRHSQAQQLKQQQEEERGRTSRKDPRSERRGVGWDERREARVLWLAVPVWVLGKVGCGL